MGDRQPDPVPARGPRVSVILPVRDRVHHLALCLDSLERQTAPAADFEVVVVDDGSGPAVGEFLAAYRAPYPLRTLRKEASTGRAAARNLGWRHSEGDVFVFLDADVLARPTLVAAHARMHAHGGALCVTGYPWFWASAFTVAFPDFSADQHARLQALARAHPALGARLMPGWQERGRPVPLLWRDELGAFDEVTAVRGARLPSAEEAARWEQALAPAPWLLFVTRDVSLRREVVADTGGFCERFVHYGLADWEYGYRLHRGGLAFRGSAAASCVHQEHPAPAGRGLYHGANYQLFLQLHPDPEVALMALRPPWADQPGYARLASGLSRLRAMAPDWHRAVSEALFQTAEKIAARAAAGSIMAPQRLPAAALHAGGTDPRTRWLAAHDPEVGLLLRELAG